jgi:hypothetical protein
MQTRTITQVLVFKLYLNPIPANYEKLNMVAVAYDKQELMDWYESLKVDKYTDGSYHKVFKQGSRLEWCNPIDYNNDDGIYEEWTTQETIDVYINKAENSFGLTAVPEKVGM